MPSPSIVAVAARSRRAAFEFLGAQHLAAIHRLVGIGERLGHPEVHAQVEVAEHEDRRLQALGQVEGLPAELEALLHRAGQQADVARVAVAQVVGLEHVALGGAGGQAGARPHALDVPDDAGDLGEVGQAGELGHQRDAGAGGGGHGARARPAGADHHADARPARPRPGRWRRSRSPVSLFTRSSLAYSLERVHQAGGRGDRIPGRDADAAEDRAQRRRPCCRRSESCRRSCSTAARGRGRAW